MNIKELHIGSHVLVDSQRVRVCGITKHKIGYHVAHKFCETLRYVRTCEAEPIPITPALLEELGFEWREDSSCWRKEINEYWVFVNGNEERGYRFSLFPPTVDGMRPVLYARHLHEIEGQLAYYGVELLIER